VPAWKKKSFGTNISYGIVTDRSIKDQREGLPIYKLRSQLLKAVAEHQVTTTHMHFEQQFARKRGSNGVWRDTNGG